MISKYIELFPLKRIDSGTVSRVLLNRVVLRYGPPSILVSDNGPQNISSVLKNLAELLGTRQVFSARYASWQNGMAERKFKSLKKLLRLTCSKTPNLWSERLPSIMYAINKAHNRSLNCSSLEMLFGYAPIPILPEISLTNMENLVSDVIVKKDLMYVREGAKDYECAYSEKENARNAKNKKMKGTRLGI